MKGDIPGLPPDAADEPSYNPMLGRAVVSDNKMYYYLHSNRQKVPGKLVRATYNADTHIIKDWGTTAETYGRTSCYHHATNPLAVSNDGYLYVTANNATEPSVMYFRSTDYNHADQQTKPTPAPDNQSQAGNGATSSKAGNAATSPKTGDSLPAAVLGAIVVLSLAGLAVANRLRRTTGRNQP